MGLVVAGPVGLLGLLAACRLFASSDLSSNRSRFEVVGVTGTGGNSEGDSGFKGEVGVVGFTGEGVLSRDTGFKIVGG